MARVKGGPKSHLRHKKVLKRPKVTLALVSRVPPGKRDNAERPCGMLPVIAAFADVICVNCG